MTAKQCVSLQEVRNEIDRIDSEMIRLSAERGGYVRQKAAAFGQMLTCFPHDDRWFYKR